ncbi:hypothetical protein PILCRDRAFT_79509 [Piloderma croceum F 1598]|uniref:RWD domain-containing protein n=1 Tax=Piloderma croceum (strain F 1598) TaxID=765440 RepID=A0A0C3AM60_PILCF|nr:hypothetical protein PILCRDRAFT_79509 [Piloderma croceum F 1598]
MTDSGRTSNSPHEQDHGQILDSFIERLMLQPDREPVASELGVLQSIYDNAIQLRQPSQDAIEHLDGQTIRYEVSLSLPSPHDGITIRILVSLPPSYPAISPPQLQLLSKYIGPYGVDSGLFGSILRTFLSVNGVEWSADTICVFDGLQNVIELCVAWYEDRQIPEKVGGLIREDVKDRAGTPTTQRSSVEPMQNGLIEPPTDVFAAMPDDIQIIESEPITDRKSTFVGRACQISHPSQVPLILSHLMSDRRISRAAHPTIHAYRCQVGTLLHQDNDDNGETAAGGRLAHLLQILEVSNCLVIVTRYFGGIHLGPDRFKHINQAARNALEIGGFLDDPGARRNTVRSKRR